MRVSQIVELSSGVDALYLSGRASLPVELLARLEAARTEAEEGVVGPPFQFGPLDMTMAPHTWGRYRYCLKHPYAWIGLTPKLKIPAIRVQPRAEFLHGVGPRAVAHTFADLLESACGPVQLQVSRIDLYADLQGWLLSGDDRHEFVSRASQTTTHEDGEVFHGLEFGKRTSGTIGARLYDKTIDVARTGSDFWRDIWGGQFNPEQPVVRTEFEVRRDALREFGLSTPDEVLNARGALWAYLTTEWLTLRVPNADETKARWPTAPEWEAVQRARIGEGAYGIKRIYDGKRRGELENLLPGLVGYLASLGALTEARTDEDLYRNLEAQVRDFGRRSGRPMVGRMEQRRRELELL